MPRANAVPVAAYDPRMISLLIEGSKRPVEITNGSPKEILSFVAKLQQLRTAMRRERHPNATEADGARLALRTVPDDEVWLVGNTLADLAGRTLKLVVCPRYGDLDKLLTGHNLPPVATVVTAPQRRAAAAEHEPDMTPSEDPDLQRLLSEFMPHTDGEKSA